MGFKIARTSRSLPSSGPGATTNMDVRTGGQQFAAGMGKAGQSLASAAETLHKLQAENQFSEARRQLQERLNLLADDFERNPDSTTYSERFFTAFAEMKQYAPKNALAARAYSNLLDSTRVTGNQMVMASALARERDLFAAGVLADMSAGKYEIAEQKLRVGPQKGMIDSEDAQVLLTKLNKEKKEVEATNRFLMMLQVARNLPDLKSQIRFINSQSGQLSKNMTEDRTLRNDAIAQLQIEEQLRQEARDGADKEVKAKINDILQSDTPDYQAALQVNSTMNDQDAEFMWDERIRAHRKRKASGADIVTNELVRGNLRQLAYSVRLDAVSFDEFKEQLDKARLDDETIDDKAYASLHELASSKFATHQDQTISDEIGNAKGALQILDEEALIQMQNDVTKGLLPMEIFQQQVELQRVKHSIWTKFQRDLHSWVAKHPDKDGKAITEQGYRLLTQLQGTAENQKRLLQEERTEILSAPPPTQFLQGSPATESTFKKPFRQPPALKKSPTSKKPVRKGPTTQSHLLIENGKPVQIFDAHGKETGLRMRDGTVFKIGDQMKTDNGKVVEYIGTHQWKEVK